LGARKVGESGGKLREEGKVTLLTRGKGSASFGNGRDKGFVIREEGEKTTFEEKTEVADSKVGSQQFTVKGGVSSFSGRKFVGKESKRLPGTTGFLL
jgi:hypothetical protein